MRALLTGASGFCGRHLCAYLQSSGAAVHAVARRPAAAAPPAAVVGHAVDDVTDRDALARVVRAAAPDVVFHLAGLPATVPSDALYRVNVGYAAALLEAVGEAGRLAATTVLLAGSAAEYGAIGEADLPIREETPARPCSHYGVSKLCQTLLGGVWAARGARVVTARLFNVIGPGMPGHIAAQQFAAQLAAIAAGRRPAVVEVGNLDSRRDVVDVRDAVRIMARLAQAPEARGAVVNVCRGSAHRTGDLLERLIRLAGIEVEIRVAADRLNPADVPVVYGSTARRERLLGPETLAELDRTLDDVWAAAREAA